MPATRRRRASRSRGDCWTVTIGIHRTLKGSGGSAFEGDRDGALGGAAQDLQGQRVARAVERREEVVDREQRGVAGGDQEVALLEPRGGGGRAVGDAADEQAVVLGEAHGGA